MLKYLASLLVLLYSLLILYKLFIMINIYIYCTYTSYSVVSDGFKELKNNNIWFVSKLSVSDVNVVYGDARI